MLTLWQDIRYATRTLAKNPGFTAVAVITLALGIGANSTVFSWVNGTMLNPLPGVEGASSLIAVTLKSKEGRSLSFSYPNYEDYRDRNTVFEGITVQGFAVASLEHNNKVERLWGESVSGNFFDVLHVKAMVGRTFLPSESEAPNRDAVMVISYALWQRSFGGDPNVAGTVVNINKQPFTIIGVTPREFKGARLGLAFDVWFPIMMIETMQRPSPLEKRGWGWLQTKARLKPGVSIAQAQAGMDIIAAQMAEEFPEDNEGRGVALYPLWKNPQGAQQIFGPVVLILMVVAGLVLLIASANVANLLLSRASARRKEIAIRVSIGASRARLIRQLLTESMLLSFLGGSVGIVTAFWTSGLLAQIIPPTIYPVSMETDLDGTVLMFSLGVTLLTGLLFGLMPAWQSSRADLVSTLNAESGRSSTSRGKGRIRNVLVVAQVSLSLLLLISAGLFVRSLRAAQNFHPGFEAESVFLATFDLFPSGYEAEEARTFYRELIPQMEALPGVESVALATSVPMGFGGGSDTSFRVDGYQPGPKEIVWAYYYHTTPGYLDTMGIQLTRGRDFTSQDNEDTEDVVIINETMAERYWKGRNPLGQQIHFTDSSSTIVGVIKDIQLKPASEGPATLMYFPLYQSSRTSVTIHLRTAGAPPNLAETIQREMRVLDPGIPIFGVTTLAAFIQAANFQQSMAASFLGVFGLIALALASVGLYGVMAFAVGQRTHEIGIRMALGAGPKEILWLVLTQGVTLLLVGTAIGLAGAFALTRFMSGLLYGVSPYDPLTYAGTVCALSFISMLACFVPAQRASRVDPMVALRYE